jgi:hypothetical protein
MLTIPRQFCRPLLPPGLPPACLRELARSYALAASDLL